MSQQYNATFNLQSNVAAQLGQINQGIQGLNRQLQGLGGSAKGAVQPMDQLGKSMQKLSQANIAQVAQGIKDLASGVRTLDRNTGKIQQASQNISDFTKAFSKSGAANVKAYADAVTKLADALQRAAVGAKELAKQGIRLGKAKTATGVPAAAPKAPSTSRVPPGMVKGAFQPVRTEESAKNLAKLGSAAQGAAIGMSVLQRNMSGVAFGIIFMQFGLVKIIALFAALTVAIGVAMGAFVGWIGLLTKAATVGMEFERRGQQMASWLRSGALAADVYRLGEELSRTFGVAMDDATELAFTLAKTGQMSDVYVKGIMNVAAANGENIAEVGHRWNAIMKADSDARAGLIQRFARDYGLPIKEYTNALELATAMNERFKGSAEAAAQTSAGMWGRVKANVSSFMISMGKIVNEILKPFLELMIAFTDGLVKGFNDAFEAAGGAEGAQVSLDSLRDSVRKLIPWVTMLGNLIGKFLFWSLQKLVQVIKFVTGALNAALKFWKEYRDEVKTAGITFVTKFTDVLNNPEIIIGAVSTFVKTFISNLVTAFKGISLGDDVVGGIWSGIGRALKTVPKSLFEGFVEGLKRGLITALWEALILTVLEYLPISEGLRNSLNGIIRAAFLGGAIGSVIPGVGTVLGAAIAAAIATGFEIAAPGSVKKMLDALDRFIIDGLKSGKDAFVKLHDYLFGDGTKAWDKDIQNVLDDNTAYGMWAEDIENKHTPRVTAAMQTMSDLTQKALGGVKDFIKGPFMDEMTKLWEHIDGPAKEAWTALQDLWDGPVKQVLTDLQPMFEDVRDILKFIWEKVIDNQVTWTALEKFWDLTMLVTANTLEEALGLIKFMIEQTDDFLNRFFIPTWTLLKDTLDLIANLCNGDWHLALESLKNIIVDILNIALAPLLFAFDTLENITGYDISGGIVAGFGFIKDAIVGASNVIAGIDWGGTFLGALEWVLKGAVKTINGLIRAYNNTLGRVVGKVSEVNEDFSIQPPPPGAGGPGVNIAEAGGGRGFRSEQHGGIVPGPRGSKRLILAEAGEYFGGAPQFANADGRLRGGGGVNVYFDLREAVITGEDAMDMLALKLGNTIARTWFSTRRMTLPRSG